MKTRSRWWLLVLCSLLIAGAGTWWLLTRHGAKTADDDDTSKAAGDAVAEVRVAPVRRGKIARTLTAYGTTASASGGTRSVSFPFECRVVAVQTSAGQMVAAGDPLLQIEPSADTRLALDTARSAQNTAEATLADTKRRFQSHLATNADLATAESADRDARIKLDSLRARTPGVGGVVQAPSAGVVTTITARPGAVIAAGSPLIELAVENRLEARLGIAPPDAARVAAGQAVRLTPVEAREEAATAAALTGTVRVIGRNVDPATRMVDAVVSLDEPPAGAAPLLIGAYLRAEIVTEEKEALLVPRAALAPVEGQAERAVVFTVAAGKAVKHEVGTGIDDGENVGITSGGDALPEGTTVVTEGAYELEEGMAVEIAKPDKEEKPATDDKDAKPAKKDDDDDKPAGGKAP